MSKQTAIGDTETPHPSLKTTFRIEKERMAWIDHARGFVMLLLVVSELMPSVWRKFNEFTMFFLEHPADSTHAQYMNVYDIGVPGFFFIIGLLMAVSFKKRVEKKGVGNAVLNAIGRWGTIYAVGMVIIFATWGPAFTFGEQKITEMGFSTFVVHWDVINSIGFVGLMCIPFMFIPKKYRLIVAYAMMVFYQVVFMIPNLSIGGMAVNFKDYAIASVHGGIIGGIFILAPITIVGSVIGEYFILDKETSKTKKIKSLGIFAAVNLAIGLILWLLPNGYPSKRQSTMGWATISLAVIIGGMFVFILINWKKERRTWILEAYGQNPFLIYALTVMPVEILKLVGVDLGDYTTSIILWIVMVSVITLIAMLLYIKGKVISTTKVAVVILIILVGLALVLLPLGIV